jgi:hypothetical protein
LGEGVQEFRSCRRRNSENRKQKTGVVGCLFAMQVEQEDSAIREVLQLVSTASFAEVQLVLES